LFLLKQHKTLYGLQSCLLVLVLSSYMYACILDFLQLFSFKLHFVNLRINENDDDDDDYDNDNDDDDESLTC